MWLRVGCSLSFGLEFVSPMIVMLRPRSNAQQWVEHEDYKVSPFVMVNEYTDAFGNLCQRLMAPAGDFSIKTAAEVKTSNLVDEGWGVPFIEIQNLPNEVLRYLMPSRYCESDRFNQLAVSITNDSSDGYNQVAAIEKWIQENISYAPGSSDFPITAMDVYERKFGVCRDLAHLGIALCRSLSIPARMVVGYLHELEPMDMHAWFEAYVGGRWYTFDATQTNPKGGYVCLGYGNDAADVPLYNQFGPALYPLEQVVTVEEIKGRE